MPLSENISTPQKNIREIFKNHVTEKKIETSLYDKFCESDSLINVYHPLTSGDAFIAAALDFDLLNLTEETALTFKSIFEHRSFPAFQDNQSLLFAIQKAAQQAYYAFKPASQERQLSSVSSVSSTPSANSCSKTEPVLIRKNTVENELNVVRAGPNLSRPDAMRAFAQQIAQIELKHEQWLNLKHRSMVENIKNLSWETYQDTFNQSFLELTRYLKHTTNKALASTVGSDKSPVTHEQINAIYIPGYLYERRQSEPKRALQFYLQLLDELKRHIKTQPNLNMMMLLTVSRIVRCYDLLNMKNKANEYTKILVDNGVSGDVFDDDLDNEVFQINHKRSEKQAGNFFGSVKSIPPTQTAKTSSLEYKSSSNQSL